MWWKVSALAVVTTLLVLLVIPIRTHAARYDSSNPTPHWSFMRMFDAMYLTPTSGLLILVIVSLAGFVALKFVRGQW